MDRQTIDNQKGEIAFRKKLYLQQVQSKDVLDDEFDGDKIIEILMQRMQKTKEQMSKIHADAIPMSPYVEIGAERCQRSLVMENDLDLSGFGVDISFDMLNSCDYYKDRFNKSKTPLRVCCDANNLPFLSNSVPFVFCYETLHHFPKPKPVVKEIYRILSPGGNFFFEEEPYNQMLHFNLYTAPKMYSSKNLAGSKIKKIFDHFLSKKNCNETDHQIIENHEISLKAWKNALKIFSHKDIEIRSGGFINFKLFNPDSVIKLIAAYLIGGSISGICRKKGNFEQMYNTRLDLFACPSCRETKKDVHIIKKETYFFCEECKKVYPVVNNVLFLFTHKKLKELYPGIFREYVK